MSSAAARCKPKIVPYEIAHAGYVARNMRQADQWEIWHSQRVGADQALRESIAISSEVYSILWGDEAVAIFGLALQPGLGIPWMLGTDNLSRCKSLLRQCRWMIEQWVKSYSRLANQVWSGNTKHIEWIKWLGFTFEGTRRIEGELFLNFHMESKCVTQFPSWPLPRQPL